MKRHQRNHIRGRAPALELDEIYNSSNPEVQEYFDQALMEEMDAAQSRAVIRVARKFQHLLSPRMQQALAAQSPSTAIAATA